MQSELSQVCVQEILGFHAPEAVLMQETIQHEAFGVNTRIGLSAESGNESVDGLCIKSSEIQRSLRVEKETVVVKLSMLEVMKKLGPDHLSNHTTDTDSVNIQCKVSFSRCITHPVPCPHQRLVRRALYNDDVATLSSREFTCNSLCATPPGTVGYGTSQTYAMLDFYRQRNRTPPEPEAWC